MYRDIRASDLDIHTACIAVSRNAFPLAPREVDSITGVGDDADPELEVISGNAVRQAIALPL